MDGSTTGCRNQLCLPRAKSSAFLERPSAVWLEVLSGERVLLTSLTNGREPNRFHWLTYCGWTKSISHHFKTMVETLFVGCKENIIPGLLRWCRISSIHSIFFTFAGRAVSGFCVGLDIGRIDGLHVEETYSKDQVGCEVFFGGRTAPCFPSFFWCYRYQVRLILFSRSEPFLVVSMLEQLMF